MITQNTVFILGAGASCDYRFPLGRLFSFLVGDALGDRDVRDWANASAGMRDADLKNLAERIVQSNISVDAFLEHNKDFRDVGKVAMARALMPFEDPEYLIRDRAKMFWYEYFRQRLGDGPDEIGASLEKLSVVTFNYDRSFEYALFYTLEKGFGEGVARDLLRKLGIVHVYGRIGLPTFDTRYSVGMPPGRMRDYSAANPIKTMLLAANEIRIMPERSDEDDEFRIGHAMIAQAERIVILGFGYDKKNFQRLHLDNFNGLPILSSVTCMKADEVRRAQLLFAEYGPRQYETKHYLILGREDEDVLKFIRTYPVFDE